MYPGRLEGSLNMFMDPASQRLVELRVAGNYSYIVNGVDPNAVKAQIDQALIAALNSVIARKIAQQQVALQTLPQSLPQFYGEIVGEAQTERFGARLQSLDLALNMSSQAMPPDPMQAMQNAMAARAKEELDPRNKVLGVNLEVGGFKLKANTRDGFDGDGLMEQAKNKAKSTVFWWAIGCGAILFVVLLLVGIGGYAWYEAKKSMAGGAAQSGASAKAATWDGKEPFECSGTQNLKLSRVTAKLPGKTAVKASGSCRLEIADSSIEGDVGVSAIGSAYVVITGSTVTGKKNALEALGSAQIKTTNTTTVGKRQALGPDAKIE